MPIVHNAVYCDDGRKLAPESLEVTYELLRDSHGMGWIGLYRPTEEEVESVGTEFGIHPLAIEDTVSAHQRPKLERYGNVLFTVLRPARYVDSEERIELGELHVFTGPDFVVTVRYAETPDVAAIRARMEADPELSPRARRPCSTRSWTRSSTSTSPSSTGSRTRSTRSRRPSSPRTPPPRAGSTRCRASWGSSTARRIRCSAMLERLSEGFDKYAVEDELQRSLRNVEDHVIRIVERVEGLRVLLQNILSVNATLVAQRQNLEIERLTVASLQQSEEVKRISSWGAILFAPTLVGTVYGMNFDHMPELGWQLGYPFAMLLMVVVGAALYAVFRRVGWL